MGTHLDPPILYLYGVSKVAAGIPSGVLVQQCLSLGHVIPGGFFNPGISGLKIRNPGIRQKLTLSQHAWFEVYTLFQN